MRLYIEYDYITVGELGDVLVRYQAATRSIAGFGRAKYAGLEERPLLLVSSIQTKTSIDVGLIVAIIGVVMMAPAGLRRWGQITRAGFHRLMVALYARIKGEHTGVSQLERRSDLVVSVTRGSVDVHAEKEFIETMSEEQKRALGSFLRALFGPAKRVVLGDEDLEITISKEGEGDPAHR